MSDEIKEMNFSEMLFNRDKRLLDYITNLQTIEREYSNLLSENAELQQENDRLNNIINELEKWCNNGIKNGIHIAYEQELDYEDILDKLKESKENK